MMNPRVNVERSSSCGSPTTASHCLCNTCRRGLCFSVLCVTKIYVPQCALTPSCPPVSRLEQLLRLVTWWLYSSGWMSLPCIHSGYWVSYTHCVCVYRFVHDHMCRQLKSCFLESLHCSKLFEGTCMLLASCLIYGRHRGSVLLQAHCFPIRDWIECADLHMAELLLLCSV